MSSMKIAIAATFTAEPLAESLNFWSEKLRWQASVAFAPYNQVFQQLLDPTSLLSTNAEGINVILVRPEEIASYRVINLYDASGDEVAHLPYTPEFFTVLGMVVARKIHALKQAPYKVIVVDCDETLWTGVCGEVGAMGIEIDPGRKSLQEFLVRQH